VSSDFHRQPRVADIESPLSTGRIGRTNPPSDEPEMARRVVDSPSVASCARAGPARRTHAASESVAPRPVARKWLVVKGTTGGYRIRAALRGVRTNRYERQVAGERSCGPASRRRAVAAKIATAVPAIAAAAPGMPAASSHDAATSDFHRLP
jgi:hypothetical protein